MKASLSLVMVLSLGLTTLVGMAQAQDINYFRSGTLQLVPGGGGDGTFGLDNAHFTMEATFTLAPYSNYFGFPILVADSGTITITGSSIAENNATFNLDGNVGGTNQSLYFSPIHNGESEFGYTPGGIPLTLFRADGSIFNIHPSFDASATTTGSAATPGTMAQSSDFFPASPVSENWSDFAGTQYEVVDETISNTNTLTSTPEPSSVTLLATGLGMGMIALRYRRRKMTRAAL